MEDLDFDIDELSDDSDDEDKDEQEEEEEDDENKKQEERDEEENEEDEDEEENEEDEEEHEDEEDDKRFMDGWADYNDNVDDEDKEQEERHEEQYDEDSDLDIMEDLDISNLSEKSNDDLSNILETLKPAENVVSLKSNELLESYDESKNEMSDIEIDDSDVESISDDKDNTQMDDISQENKK